ncbi:MarR family winged helix-turn-helix transcriptional regulator [Sedimentibacter saalensis]|jgi:DNA-binding MarR family transcriptional regulator|uniref:DNA-binding MarR family transcriptional regulator n=2 Tax=Sedimentibacter saalensis TaxID=130788 RepID=A0A562J4W4_9FIRM|nr:MarR family transcriptional regulator [Sedimentibacter saalensis]TWH78210.1 DNA-binding MarR family transcriptional regulator [Sedimentibacter saalensis]
MFFNLNKCVGHITENAIKQISEAFGRRLQNSGITRIQWIALYYVKTNKRISQRELSNLMNVKDSSAGRLIDRLERDGFIERERDNSDRRVVYIQLSEAGDKLISDLMPIGIKFNEDLVSGIDENELIIYEKVLQKMILNTKK